MSRPSRLALGTVQWGIDGYGIANRTGRTDSAAVRTMLDAASAAGVDTLDTAAAYGRAEDVVGQLTGGEERWRIVTKLAPGVWAPGRTREDGVAATRASLAASRRRLRREHLDVVLLHRPAQRTACDGAIWDVLREERDAGGIGRIGISALTPADALEALTDPDVAAMQVASSLLDQRLSRAGFFEAARQADCEVHVRSTFLQGVAFLGPERLPAHLEPARALLQQVDDWSRARSVSRHVAFLAHAWSLPAGRLVLGCESLAQLQSNLAAVEAAADLAGEVSDLAASVPDLPDAVLDPSQWPRG